MVLPLFDKKKVRMKKKGILQSFIKEPLEIDYDNDMIDEIGKSRICN
jgi:hypothetical protein